ncbi:MAG: type II secretion system secretin GspD [Gammaproteobacteria bacterium]
MWSKKNIAAGIERLKHTKCVLPLNRIAAAALFVSLFLIMSAVFAQPVTMNLKDADISAVISTVSEVTGKNFIIDPRVKGKVTIISSKPMEGNELYEVFLSILEVHGFSAVPNGSVIKIVPDANAKQKALPLATDRAPGDGDEVVPRVIQLDNVSASQLVPILRPLVPQQGHLAAYVPGNVLIISDRAANIQRLMDIIQRIDMPSGDEIEIITLRHASASEVVRILTSLEQQQKGKVGGQLGASESPVLIADERTNSILIGGGRSGRLRLRAIISHLDTPLASSGNTRVFYLRYAQAKDLVQVLTGVSNAVEQQNKAKAGGAAAAQRNLPVNIQADESTNALVITAPQDMIRSLEVVIKQLDVRRAQVMVETIIAEVSENLAAELGVEWIVDSTPGGDGPVGSSNFGTLGSLASAAVGAAVPSLPTGLMMGIGVFNDSQTNFAAILRALRGDGTTNILSTPTLVTMDNEEAEIVVGQNVPFITGSFSSTGSGTTPTNPFQTIQREDVGITLKVKPQINEGDAVKLELEQKVDSVAASAAGAADLVTNTRSIKTSVMVDDGHMIVLGGLLDDTVTETVQKVPLLGDIPLLGTFFSSKTTKKEKRNLMVFLRPVIIRDSAVTTRLTNSKYEYMRAKQMDIRDKGFMFLKEDDQPVMAPFEEFLAVPPPFDAPEETIERVNGLKKQADEQNPVLNK